MKIDPYHWRDIPHLRELVRGGSVRPSEILTQHQPLLSAVDAYQAFDERQPGWMKVMLEPAAV